MLARTEGINLVTEGVISEIEREALVELRDKLRSGEIESYYHPDLDRPHDDNRPRLLMSVWYEPSACGTIGCIAGLAFHLSGRKAFPEVSEPDTYPSPRWSKRCDKLMELFLPNEQRTRMPADAEHAITTFLATGKADWGPSEKTPYSIQCAHALIDEMERLLKRTHT